MNRARPAVACLAHVAGVSVLAAAWPLTAAAEGTKAAGKFDNWTLHVSDTAGTKICFAATEPREKKPAGAKRTTAVLYVSTWPKDGVKTEISVKLGFKIKAGSKIAVEIGKDTFKLFPNDERAYVADGPQESKLLDAMMKAPALTVQAAPERGDLTTDTYSLAGLSQALAAMAQSCP